MREWALSDKYLKKGTWLEIFQYLYKRIILKLEIRILQFRKVTNIRDRI